LVIGAATDTASALLVDPHLADRIEIVAMAFRQWPAGGDNFNVVNDPIAWEVLLDSKVPITVGDATVTARHLKMTRKQAHTLLGTCGKRGPYLASLLDDWLDRHGDLVESVTDSHDIWPVWDEVVVAHLLGFTHSESYPRPELGNDLQFVISSSPERSIRWITDIDEGALWRDLTQRLGCL
jgi:inosine-uridine nucleoside N-ribohydrolase